jgi:hypothetical protein
VVFPLFLLAKGLSNDLEIKKEGIDTYLDYIRPKYAMAYPKMLRA